VATLTSATRDILEGSFPYVWVHGEVVGFKEHRSGHWYFTLKDADAQLRCVSWASERRAMLVAPDDGMAVVVRGQLTVYPARGDLQFRVLALQGVGDGLWRKAFEETRARLERDGLLAPQRKRGLPLFPRCVAVVTSTDGAALHDVVAVVRRRCPGTRVVAVPATVQGETATASIRRALARVARWGEADVVIVGRGGGGREDLWAFNDEGVARAIADMPMPVISAVGHEIDVTLCDLVADARAPTPSAAAEAAVPVLSDLVRRVRNEGTALTDAIAARLALARDRAGRARAGAERAARRLLERRAMVLRGVGGRLHALSPLATMARGFAVVTDREGRAIVRAASVSAGDELRLNFRDGAVVARAERIERGAAPADGAE
jgi:exodeoxyribonuclease VII large subunit